MNIQDTKEKLNNVYIHACIAGVFVVMMYIALLVIDHIVPFGNNTWIMYDLKRQYVDYYSYYKTIISGDNDLFYSFSTTLGSGIFSLFIYYLTNPLFLIFTLFTPDRFPVAISIIIGITLVFGEVIMDIFLQWYLDRKAGCKHDRWWIWIFSIAWAFSGFLIAQSMNMMWTDVVILVPVMIYMLENVIENQKYLGYVLILSLILILNYYITYQVLIFIGMWTLMRVFTDKKERAFTVCIRVGLLSVLSAGIDAIVLVPTALSLANSPKDITKLGLETVGNNHNPIDILSKIYVLAYDVVQPRFGLPQLYCGIVLMLLVILFFCCKRIPASERVGFGILLLIFMASFCTDVINLFWHAGMEPSGHPYRQAPLCVFLIILCACRAFDEAEYSWKQVSIASTVLIIILGVCTLVGYEYVTPKMVLINVLVIVIDAALLMRNRKKLILCLVTIELLVNAAFTYPFVGMKAENTYDYAKKNNTDRELVEHIKQSDDGFYRMENLTPRQQNDGMMYVYNGVTHYSSAGLTYVRDFLRRCGFNDDGLYTAYGSDNTMTIASLLGVKYLISDSEPVYENPYVLPIAVGVNGCNYYSGYQVDITNPFEFQEFIINDISEIKEDIFIPATLEPVNNDFELKVTFGHSGEQYLYIDGLAVKNLNLAIYVDGELLSGYGNLACYKILHLGNYDVDDSIVLKLDGETEGIDVGDIRVVTEDTDALQNVVSGVDKTVDITRLSSSHINMVCEKCDGIFTTIPYEHGWSIHINNKKVEPFMIYDALMYIPTGEAGVIDLRYRPYGIVVGAIVSTISVSIAAALYLCIKKKAK